MEIGKIFTVYNFFVQIRSLPLMNGKFNILTDVCFVHTELQHIFTEKIIFGLNKPLNIQLLTLFIIPIYTDFFLVNHNNTNN